MASSATAEFERINFKKVVPAVYRAMLVLEAYVHHTGLHASLHHAHPCERARCAAPIAKYRARRSKA